MKSFPLRPRNLLPRDLFLAILTFLVLDLLVLAMGYAIGGQLDKDAVAINLAGRQRMLSQRVTKAALLASNPALSEAQRRAAAAQAARTYARFQQTLNAFASGGPAEGGDGKPVQLQAVRGLSARMVTNVIEILKPWPQAPLDGPQLRSFTNFMVDNNEAILDAMNRLTTEVEHQSSTLAWRLRIVQTVAFILSLINFVAILRIAEQARQRAEAASMTDSLTGALNRAGVFKALGDALAALESFDMPLGVVLIDLDNFKSVNDQLGHAEGDETLRKVARRIDSWRSPGWAYGRMGGDEFAIVCSGSTAHELEQAAESLKKLLSNIRRSEPFVSASVGLAIADRASTADTLFAEADAMMYSHKSGKSPASGVRRHER